jgi:hypothetical protein
VEEGKIQRIAVFFFFLKITQYFFFSFTPRYSAQKSIPINSVVWSASRVQGNHAQGYVGGLFGLWQATSIGKTQSLSVSRKSHQHFDGIFVKTLLIYFSDDGKDGLKFYTDATYFFELWRQDMLKDTERMMHDRGKKVQKSLNFLKLLFRRISTIVHWNICEAKIAKIPLDYSRHNSSEN